MIYYGFVFPLIFLKEETSVFTLLAYLLFCIVFVFPRTIYFLCRFLACTWHIIIYLGFFQWVAEVKVWRHEEEATFGDLTGHLGKGNWCIDKKWADQSTLSDQYHLEWRIIMYINDLISDIMIFLYNKREYICCHVTDSKMNFKVFTLNQRNHCYITAGTQSLNTCICCLLNDALFFINNTLVIIHKCIHVYVSVTM